jgi:hypothetical protein
MAISADNRRNILLIDNSVENYSQIVDSVDALLSDVIVFDRKDQTYNDIIIMIRNKLNDSTNHIGYKSVGVLQHNSRLPYYQFLTHENNCTLLNVEENDPTLNTWSEYIDFLTTIKTEFSVTFLDLLACAIYSDVNWKYVIDIIASKLQIEIRASTDDTGAASLGGNWFLESHTGVNLKTVYFTDLIDEFTGLLDMMFMVSPTSQFAWNNMITPPSTLAVWGDNLTSTVLSTSLSSKLVNITRVFSNAGMGGATKYGYIFALDTSGVLYGIGNKTFGSYILSSVINNQSHSGIVDYFTYGGLLAYFKSDGYVGFISDSGGDTYAYTYYTTLREWVYDASIDQFFYTTPIAAYNLLLYNNDPNRLFCTLDDRSTFRTYVGPRNVGYPYPNSGEPEITITNVARVIIGTGQRYLLLTRNRTIVAAGDTISWTNIANIYPSAGSYAGAVMFGLDMSHNLLYQSVLRGYDYEGLGMINAPSVARTNVVAIRLSCIPTFGIGLILQLNGNVTGWSKTNISTNHIFTSQDYQAVNIYITKGDNGVTAVIEAALKYDGSLYIRGTRGINTYTSQPVVDVVPGFNFLVFLLNNGNVVLHTSSNTFVTVVNTNNAVGLYLFGENEVNVIKTDGSLVRYYAGSITYNTSVVTYNGSDTQSNTILNSNVKGVVATAGLQAAAIQTSSSLSSFNKLDLFQYFRSRNNRRINNFNSLNGTYTISDYRTITLINPFLPTNKSYTLIIPDYQSSANLASSPYNIKSNVTIYGSVSNFITAIDEGEQFTINGNTSTTYVLHSPHVYTVTTSPTFALTKVTSTIDTSYNTFVIYGDGAFVGIGNPVNPSPSLSIFYTGGITKQYGDVSFNLTDPSSNNTTGAFTFTIDNSNVAIVNSGGRTVTIIGAGTATISASQAATADFSIGTITTVLQVSLRTPSLSQSTFSVRGSATYGAVGDISFGVTTLPTSDNTYAPITYASNNTSIATIHSTTGVITPAGFGTTTFTASQVAVENKYTATSITSNALSIARGSTTLSRVSMNSAISKTFGIDSTTFDICANSLSSGAVTYYSSDASCATINVSTGTVSLVSAGQTTLTAQQAQSLQYNAPIDISAVLTVNRGTTSLSRVSFDASINKIYSDLSFNVEVSTASNGTKTYNSSDITCATIDSSGHVILVASGSTTITISQAQSGQYYAPTDISAVLSVVRATPVLTRSTFPSTLTKTYGDGSFVLVATSTNTDIPVSYESSLPSVATVNSVTGSVTLVSSGTTTITASQVQTSRYYAPNPLTVTLDVSRGNVTLIGFPSTFSKNITQPPFTITATSDSSGVITYESNNSSTATINASTGLVTLKTPGTVTLIARQAQTQLYNAPANVSCVLEIASAGNALAGQVISSTQSFNGVNLTGASLVGTTLTNVSLSGAILANVDFSGAIITNTNFTNANISGANISNVSFSPVQKLQLLKNINNREIGGIQIQDVSASAVLAVIPQTSALFQIPNIATIPFKVIVPQTASSLNTVIENATISNTSSAFYMPINEGEYFKINNVSYYVDGSIVKNATTGAAISVMANDGKFYKVFAGSLAGVVLDLNTFTIKDVGLGELLTANFNPIYITDISHGLIAGASRYNYTNNSFRIPYSSWEFDTYEYDIDLELTTNYTPVGAVPWTSMYWCMNSDDASGSRYYNTFSDISGGISGSDSGVNNSAYVHNLRSNNKIIQHYCKMKLRKVGGNFTGAYSGQYSKILLESTETSTALNTFSSTDVTTSWTGRSINTYTNTTTYNNSTIDFYVNGSDWTTYTQCYYRLKKRLR